MSSRREPRDAERFRRAIAHRLGLAFEDHKLAFLANVLDRRSEKAGQSSAHYLSSLEAGAGIEELSALAEELTVPETYFFRNNDQFRAFVGAVLPARMEARARTRSLRFLSAGCATGEEPYTLAILLKESVPEDWDVLVRAIDMNPTVLAKAARGRFTEWSLRETPPEARQRWFRVEGKELVLHAAAKALVRFDQKNLAEEGGEVFAPETYDAVFCRNVLMYFIPETAKGVVGRITRALVPGGFFFMGHAETLRGLSNDFHLRHTHDTFYYERRGTEHAASTVVDRQELDQVATMDPSLLELDQQSWVDTIGRASARIEGLSAKDSNGDIERSQGARKPDLGRALELLGNERFADALELFDATPLDQVFDTDALLVQAALLIHCGKLEEAEAASRRLIELDELSAAAHYVLALCREGAGDGSGAVDQDQLAAYLDPSFAMPRLHLGLIAKRSGDVDTATREMRKALTLLEREDAARVLLFGGGFSRDALSALCRSELRALGGAP